MSDDLRRLRERAEEIRQLVESPDDIEVDLLKLIDAQRAVLQAVAAMQIGKDENGEYTKDVILPGPELIRQARALVGEEGE